MSGHGGAVKSTVVCPCGRELWWYTDAEGNRTERVWWTGFGRLSDGVREPCVPGRPLPEACPEHRPRCAEHEPAAERDP